MIRDGGYAIKFEAQGESVTDHVYVKYLRWVGGEGAGDALQVTDGTGKLVFESEADGPNFLDLQPIFGIIRGISVPTMDSGELLVIMG